jgi:hypothetical protein
MKTNLNNNSQDARLRNLYELFNQRLADPLRKLNEAGFTLEDADLARESAWYRGQAIAAFNIARERAEARFFEERKKIESE